jgi:diadenosine tetraphosphate (Ap4A) HIT family hydrolase
MYNENNIFAKIIRGEISSKKIYEDDEILAFYDINPKKRIHALIIPKGQYVDFSNFISYAKMEEVTNFFVKANFIAKEVLHLESFKILVNNGENAGQEVMHFHLHILSD